MKMAMSVMLALLCGSRSAAMTPWEAVQQRVQRDVMDSRPVVVHVVVALCDNLNQGIVPVPKALGNGQDPNRNLYWGAAFGVRTFLAKAGWSIVSRGPGTLPILERVVFRRTIRRGNTNVTTYLVADAFDGLYIRDAIARFLAMAAGRNPEDVVVQGSTEALKASGAAHLLAYVGHDGLMDFSLEDVPRQHPTAPPRSSMVLACASRRYFGDHLARSGSHALLLATGLMAPECYTLDAAITEFVKGSGSTAVREAAAVAYGRYQHCTLKAARQLFWVAP